jgi:hypothetical protein
VKQYIYIYIPTYFIFRIIRLRKNLRYENYIKFLL